MSFPFETEEIMAEEIKEPCEYGINFDTGQLTGKKVFGKEALKVWIWGALKTPRYRHIINSWDYGHEIEDLIGKNYSSNYIELELQRMIEECLSINPNIVGISEFEHEFNDDKLTIRLTIETTYGEVNISV